MVVSREFGRGRRRGTGLPLKEAPYGRSCAASQRTESLVPRRSGGDNPLWLCLVVRTTLSIDRSCGPPYTVRPASPRGTAIPPQEVPRMEFPDKFRRHPATACRRPAHCQSSEYRRARSCRRSAPVLGDRGRQQTVTLQSVGSRRAQGSGLPNHRMLASHLCAPRGPAMRWA